MDTLDRIEKRTLLRASNSRVWRAITDSAEFGTWFGVTLENGFAVGTSVRGRITHPGYEHVILELTVESIDAERLFSYRWHPYAVDPAIDYSGETTTLVEFRLEKVAEGTMLTVTESGFSRIPLERRDEAFRAHSEGWDIQLENIQRHVAG